MTNHMCRRRPTLPEVEGLGGRQVGVQAVLASWRKGGVHDGRYADQHHILHGSSIAFLRYLDMTILNLCLSVHSAHLISSPANPLPTMG